jgi:hypothetical protein
MEFSKLVGACLMVGMIGVLIVVIGHRPELPKAVAQGSDPCDTDLSLYSLDANVWDRAVVLPTVDAVAFAVGTELLAVGVDGSDTVISRLNGTP